MVKGASDIISDIISPLQQMHRSAKTAQRCTAVCHILLMTTAYILRQKVKKKSEGWSLPSFSFLFILFVFSVNESHTGPILLTVKWLVNSSFWINFLRAREHSCELHQPSPAWEGHRPPAHSEVMHYAIARKV